MTSSASDLRTGMAQVLITALEGPYPVLYKREIVEAALLHELVLSQAYALGGRLCILQADGRVIPLPMGVHDYNQWKNWKSEDVDLPDGTCNSSKLSIVRYKLPFSDEQHRYCFDLEIYGEASEGISPRTYDVLRERVEAHPEVMSVNVSRHHVTVLSHALEDSQMADQLEVFVRQELQAVLIVSPIYQQLVVKRLDVAEALDECEAIGFLDPDWSTD